MDQPVLLRPVEPRQYTSLDYGKLARANGVVLSVGMAGESYDNALAESVIGLYKTELHRNPAALSTNGGPWKGLTDLDVATCAWVSWFNTERLHSELTDRTPAEVEEGYYAASAHAAVA